MKTHRLSFILSLPSARLAALLCAGVLASASVMAQAPAVADAAEPQRERVTVWLDMYRAEPLPFTAVVADLTQADIVFVGETHTLRRHHAWQARILEEMIKAKDGKVVLGLEQVEAFNQPELDRFNQGKIDFDQLAKAIDWGKRWRNYEDYRALVELAQKNKVPVLGLNGRAETIRKIGRQGIDALSASERRELPKQINFDEPDYRRLLDQMMQVHAKMDEKMLGRIFQAQVARDENMAATLANFLSEPQHRGYSAMVVTGSGHIAYGLGTVSRVRSRLPEHRDRIVLMTVSGELVLSKKEAEMASRVSISHEDLRFLKNPKADYLQLTEPGE